MRPVERTPSVTLSLSYAETETRTAPSGHNEPNGPSVKNEHGVIERKLARKRRKILAVVMATFVLQGVVTAWAIYQLETSRQWDPLGDYPEQQADPEVTVPDGSLTATVHVDAVKCAHKTVGVTRSSSWVSTEPPGSQIPTFASAGATIRDKGCVTSHYENVIPPDVISRTRLLGGRVTWRITGVELPVDADRTGVPSVWRTTPILVVAEGSDPLLCPVTASRGC